MYLVIDFIDENNSLAVVPEKDVRGPIIRGGNVWVKWGKSNREYEATIISVCKDKKTADQYLVNITNIREATTAFSGGAPDENPMDIEEGPSRQMPEDQEAAGEIKRLKRKVRLLEEELSKFTLYLLSLSLNFECLL